MENKIPKIIFEEMGNTLTNFLGNTLTNSQ